MEISVLKSSKDEIEMSLETVTLAEILRVYLNQDPSVTFAAWKRNHPSEKPIVKVITRGKSVKKAINDAISKIMKELDVIEKEFKSIK